MQCSQAKLINSEELFPQEIVVWRTELHDALVLALGIVVHEIKEGSREETDTEMIRTEIGAEIERSIETEETVEGEVVIMVMAITMRMINTIMMDGTIESFRDMDRVREEDIATLEETIATRPLYIGDTLLMVCTFQV